ncbi:helix-turn-helix domain-containing protein [Nonomuraea zeae]|uniref:Helix-turn-helix domain-containing protein n=1 Tax=Nonomuraea zeae TaxID=1642303 RepID=A0A5S4H2Z0_9ACTN|nr:helix-turn-helix domain-containing protein [Nonomuraea zeae]TMR39623.1 helix-turn-helix domain-containing protein [Nonomuraea zeae]
MTTKASAVVPVGLRCVRRNLGLEQQYIAAQLDVAANTVSHWEHGYDNPPAHQMVAYAALVERRLMVGRDRRGMYDLARLLPNLSTFRRVRKLTQQQVAHRMHVSVARVGVLERRARYRKPVGWDSVVRYFAALDYEIGIAKVQAARAA